MSLTKRGTGPTAQRIAESVLCGYRCEAELDEFFGWLRGIGRQSYTETQQVALEDLHGWRTDPETGNIGHLSGKFFTVEGLSVRIPEAPVPAWTQPIINQPEVGILGAIVKEIDGVLHFLMQAKDEPGNENGLQLSPTVQATRSNYTGVHRGRSVPYVEYFRDSARHTVLADVRQSEQGSWFYQKRNRNIVIEVHEDVPLREGFRWFTLGQIHRLLALDDVVNMDARTVLACLPFTAAGLSAHFAGGTSGFAPALVRSCSPDAGGLHTLEEILSWITEARVRHEVFGSRIGLSDVKGWHRDPMKISHESGRFFDVVGVRVKAAGREVSGWDQPMIKPHSVGVIALLVKQIGGVLHALVNARVEPGYLDVVELAPTVQCSPGNYDGLPPGAAPPFLDDVLHAPAGRVRFQATLSEEGGRFFHALNRYLIVETDLEVPGDHPGYRWMTVHQLAELVKHSHYLNIQARSLLACLHSMFADAVRRSC